MSAALLDGAPWPQVSARLDEALALTGPERGPWLARLRADDAALAATVARLLGHAALQADAEQPGAFDALLLRALQNDDQPAPAEPELAGRQLGAWRLLHKIGEGGMGQVWLASRADGLYEAQAAIKLLRGDFLQRAQWAERFARERAALARLNHPGIARLLDAGMVDGLAFLVLEHVAGLPLAAYVASDACPTVAARVRLLLGVAQAVEHAHAQLIVHRDLTPSNVMVTADGAVKLLDFGIAGLLDHDDQGQLTRLTGRGLTLAYAAPEQVSGAPVGVAADLFSLGVMLFELLTGTLPFAHHAPPGSTRSAMEFALLHSEPQRLAVALRERAGEGARPTDADRALGDLAAIVAKALRKQPAERYATAGALIDDLQRWLAHRPVSARQDDWRHRTTLWLRRHAVSASLGGTLALAVVVGLAVSTTQWRRAEAAAHQSDQVTEYLTDLLGSASPDVHGGESPNVLQLLEKSRTELATKFKDEPETKARLLDVLTKTYEGLSRYDLAGPLAEEWIALTAQRYGEDDIRTVNARLRLAQLYTPNGPWDGVIAQLEPLRPRVARLMGPQSETMREMLYCLANAQQKTGLLDAAELTMRDAGALTDALYPLGGFDRAFHHNFVSVLRSAQGRLSEALAELRQTEAAQAQASTDNLRHALAMRRNTWAMQIRLGDYEHIEERGRGLAAEMDHLHGVGSATRVFLYLDLARYHADRGEFALALADREAFLAGNNGTPKQALAAWRAAVLLARALVHSAPASELSADAHTLLASINTDSRQLGAIRRAEAWLALARSGLLLGDLGLAAEAIQRLRGDAELHLQQDHWLDSRVAQAEGELLRAQGQFERSRTLLAQRVALLATSPDLAVPTIWQARLDLACTLVLMHDPHAEEALALAEQARPPQMPAGHPLDAVQAYLRVLNREGGDAATTRSAWLVVQKAYGRGPGHGEALAAGLVGVF